MVTGTQRHDSTSVVINKKDGSSCKSVEEMLERWCEHYKDMLNHSPADACPALDEAAADAVPDTESSSDAPTLQEVTKAIRKLRNGKAAGSDNIQPELLKYADLPLPLLARPLGTASPSTCPEIHLRKKIKTHLFGCERS